MELVKRETFLRSMTPTLGSSIGFTTVFSIFFIINLIFCVYYHQWVFLCTWGVGLAIEVVGYAFRLYFNLNGDSFRAFIVQFVFLVIGPCFLINGLNYVQSQIILVYGNQYSVLKPMDHYHLFLIFDLACLIIEAVGCAIYGRAMDVNIGEDRSSSAVSDLGRYIACAGLALQVVSITTSQIFWYVFLRKISKRYKEDGFNPEYRSFREKENLLKRFIIGISFSFLCIYIRCIYRTVERGTGYPWSATVDESNMNFVEGMMVALAGLLLIVVSPGFVYGRYAGIDIREGRQNYPKDVYYEPAMKEEQGPVV